MGLDPASSLQAGVGEGSYIGGGHGLATVNNPNEPMPRKAMRKGTAEQTAQSALAALCELPAPVDPRRCALPCLRRMPSPGKGDGLWTREFIPKETIIGVYTGMVITDVNAAVPAKFQRYTMRANDDGFYRIMADPERDVLCLVNEPDKDYLANLHLQFVRVEVGTRRDVLYVVVYVTAHDIQPRTELLVSYGSADGKGHQHFIRDGYQPGGPPASRELPALSEHLTDAFNVFCATQQLSPVNVAYSFGAVEADEAADVRSSGLQDLEETMRDMNARACQLCDG